MSFGFRDQFFEKKSKGIDRFGWLDGKAESIRTIYHHPPPPTRPFIFDVAPLAKYIITFPFVSSKPSIRNVR